METIAKDAVTGCETIPRIIEIQPVEVSIEYESPGSLEVCCKREPAEEQGTAEVMEGWSASSTVASECLASVKIEPCVEAEGPEYSNDVSEVDIKQEVCARAEVWCKQEPAEEQGTAEEMEGRSASNARASECPASVKIEPCLEAEGPEYNIDVSRVDVMRKCFVPCAAGGLGIGNLHSQGDTNIKDHHSFLGNDTSSNSTSLQNRLPGGYKAGTSVQESTQQKSPSCFQQVQSSKCGISPTYQERPETFIQSSLLQNRKKIHKIPTTEKSFTCHECGKTCSQKANLISHMKIHTGEKPFSCHVCGKPFARSSCLRIHMKMHTGEKPHCCLECGKRFIRSSCLKTHMKTHTGEKPFSCPKCGKCFSQSSSLRTHMSVHTDEKPHACQECSKTFGQLSSLRNHMFVHTGKKPHPCPECGMSFTQSSKLKSHLNSHYGLKPYSCQECGKFFTRSSTLYTHMKIHSTPARNTAIS